MLLHAKLTIIIDATKFKEAFEAAKKFNLMVKEGKPEEELVYAPAVEDVEEQPDPADDPEKNKTAGDDEGAGGDDEWFPSKEFNYNNIES